LDSDRFKLKPIAFSCIFKTRTRFEVRLTFE